MPGQNTQASDESGRAAFATTHWSVVLTARQSDSPEASAALETLCRTYWYPLYVFIRRQGYGAHEAEDLTQTMSTGSMVSISYHKSAIRTLAFSRDGRILASGSEDNTVKLWHVRLGRELASFKHEAHVRLVVFSLDGNTLASEIDNGTLRVFRTVSLEEADEDLNTHLGVPQALKPDE